MGSEERQFHRRSQWGKGLRRLPANKSTEILVLDLIII
jgi:hypothetical protein